MHASEPILLSGRIVLPDGGARQRYVLISDGAIRWISRSRPPAAFLRGAREVVSGPQDWIFPGLADLHTHTWYNLLPLWSSPRVPFDNRHVWRADPAYKASIAGVLNRLQGHVAERKVFSELQALAGGTTLLDEPKPLDAERTVGGTLLCRDTGNPRDLGLSDDREVRSVVDFFKPESGVPRPVAGRDGEPGPLESYERDRSALQAVLLHLAEGRSGFGSYRGVDPYSRAEYEALMAHPAMRDVDAVRRSHLSIVHGCGIDVDDPRHIDFLVERGISVIWSPVSNLLLYQDTLDAERLIQRGVNVALGSDWSPSGSKHVWDEAKFARFFFEAIGSPVSDADVFKMVTTNPGRCLGLPHLGRIEEGAAADLFILRSPIESDDALEVFFRTTDRDVLATIVDGLPIYGDATFLQQFALELQPLPEREGSAVRNKVVHLPASTGVPSFAEAIDALEDQLKALDPPVLRSNLLADSDVPYRRRMQLLRAEAERFAWSVRQWRRKARSVPDGTVPVAAGSVRVRVGYRRGGNAVAFGERLLGTVLPAAAVLGRFSGTTALLSALAPESRPPGFPDEVGLEFYERPELYPEALGAIGGRARELLEEAVFDADLSWSAFPSRYRGSVAPRSCYHLFDRHADWHVGEVRLLWWARRPEVEPAAFHAAVVQALDGLVEAGGCEGAVAAVGDDHVALWILATRGGSAPAFDPAPALAEVAEPVLDRVARDEEAKASLTDAFPGFVPPAGGDGDCLRVLFERRTLRAW